MLNTNNQEDLLRILSCIFAVIIIFCMFMSRNAMDLAYLGVISGFICKYVVKCCRK